MKKFCYGEIVQVKLPGKRAFRGTYYSEYKDGPAKERRICVTIPSGAGISYLVRYVHQVKP